MATPPAQVAVMRIEKEIEDLQRVDKIQRGGYGYPSQTDVKRLARVDGMLLALGILKEEIG